MAHISKYYLNNLDKIVELHIDRIDSSLLQAWWAIKNNIICKYPYKERQLVEQDCSHSASCKTSSRFVTKQKIAYFWKPVFKYLLWI